MNLGLLCPGQCLIADQSGREDRQHDGAEGSRVDTVRKISPRDVADPAMSSNGTEFIERGDGLYGSGGLAGECECGKSRRSAILPWGIAHPHNVTEDGQATAVVGTHHIGIVEDSSS